LTTILFLISCTDNATTIKYEKNVDTLPCLKLLIFPPDKMIEKTIKKLYKFNAKCNYEMIISKKSGIICNSNQNAARKTFSNFPSGFIRLDIYKNKKPIYSYYKDLTSKIKESDIKNAFLKLKKDML